MAQMLSKKVNTRLKFLYRNKQQTQQTRILLVMSFIQCHYDYASCIWYYGLNKCLKNKLQTSQNKLIRFVLNLSSRVHIEKEHFKQLKNMLPVHSRVEQLTLCHVFKTKNSLSPQYMREHFISLDNVHSYNTRQSCKGAFVVPKVKSFGQKSFCYNGCKLWNSLPSHFNEITKLSHFKSVLKQHLLDRF